MKINVNQIDWKCSLLIYFEIFAYNGMNIYNVSQQALQYEKLEFAQLPLNTSQERAQTEQFFLSFSK